MACVPHTLVHVLFTTYMFPYERLYKHLKAWGSSRLHPERSMLNGFVKYQQALWSQAENTYYHALGVSDFKLQMMADHTRPRPLLDVQQTDEAGPDGEPFLPRPDYER